MGDGLTPERSRAIAAMTAEEALRELEAATWMHNEAVGRPLAEAEMLAAVVRLGLSSPVREAEPEAHDWMTADDPRMDRWPALKHSMGGGRWCYRCGVAERRDGKNKPCKGVMPRIGLREAEPTSLLQKPLNTPVPNLAVNLRQSLSDAPDSGAREAEPLKALESAARRVIGLAGVIRVYGPADRFREAVDALSAALEGAAKQKEGDAHRPLGNQ